MSATGRHYLEDAILQMRKLKELADRALAQLPPGHRFEALDEETNSVALVLKHVSGNQRSRWRDFLVSDGEKPDRNRDGEFVTEPADTWEGLLARWEEGWSLVLAALEPLAPEDLERTVRIRGEEHTVLQAIDRQMTHYAYHVGQIVLLARHFAGKRWRSLSIPRGGSRDFEVSRDGQSYRPGGQRRS